MVPEELLPEVYAFLAERMRHSDARSGEAERSWTLQDAAQLSHRTNYAVLQLMDGCRRRHPKPVSTSEFVEATGISLDGLRSGLGGLTRTLKAVLPGLPYPIESGWGPNLGEESPDEYYWLTDEFAAVWGEFRLSSAETPGHGLVDDAEVR